MMLTEMILEKRNVSFLNVKLKQIVCLAPSFLLSFLNEKLSQSTLLLKPDRRFKQNKSSLFCFRDL